MLQLVDIGERSLEEYRGVADDGLLEQLRAGAARLRGARVLHINATGYGGGVAELLRSTVPLLNDLGLVCDWRTIRGDDRFFDATKAIHNGLQGSEHRLSEEEREAYLASSQENAAQLEEEYDVVFVHDPQPAALLDIHGKGDARWIWRCHIDTSAPNPDTWEFLRSFLAGYDVAIFTMDEFVAPGLPIGRVEIVPPAIDPLSPKNIPLPEQAARQILGWIGLRADLPLVTQVSRFDPWKDPLGVIAAYRLARERHPRLQLVLAGSMALDDPEGWDIYQRIAAETDADPLIHVFTNLTGVGNIEVNALQRLSDVVVQKSLREGFGLVVSEAMWKGTPVVAGRAGGIPLQMADGVGGMLVDSVESCAEAIARLVGDSAHAAELGASGRERVREHFLLPRLLLNEVSLLLELAREEPLIHEHARAEARRDPVCGMAIDDDAHIPTAAFRGDSYSFCSQACRLRFETNPEHYIRRPEQPARP